MREPWCWNIYLQNWVFFGGFYGKYSSTEHRRFSENHGFPVAELIPGYHEVVTQFFLLWLIPTKSPTDQKYPQKKDTSFPIFGQT
jgi:hypothetical protein